MRKIPPKLQKDLANDPYYKKCCRRLDGGCDGRITWEHAIIYGGKQLNKKWAIIPLCEKHHGVGKYQESDSLLNKEINICIALNRASTEDLWEISKAISYGHLRGALNRKYRNKYRN
jgi:hypothetical protein